jgi:hypothetical protein
MLISVVGSWLTLSCCCGHLLPPLMLLAAFLLLELVGWPSLLSAPQLVPAP